MLNVNFRMLNVNFRIKLSWFQLHLISILFMFCLVHFSVYNEWFAYLLACPVGHVAAFVMNATLVVS